MNGVWLGSKAIRVNWANQKQSTTPAAAGGRRGADIEQIMALVRVFMFLCITVTS